MTLIKRPKRLGPGLGLTEKQARFVSEYLADPERDANAAAARAGYERHYGTGKRLLGQPAVQNAIQVGLVEQVQDPKGLTPELIITGVLELIQSCRQAGVGAWQASTILKAYELLGKHLGMFVERLEVGLDKNFVQILAEGRERARLSAEAESHPMLLVGDVSEAESAPTNGILGSEQASDGN